MPIEQKLIKVEDNSPDRCQSNIRTGQCPWRKVEGSDYCPMHQGGTKIACSYDAKMRNYRLAQYQSRVNEFADNPQLKSLREEIGITRLVLESLLDRCKDSYDLMLYSSKISKYINDIERLVSSCHRLEYSSGLLLDKNSLIQVANTFVEIVSRHIDNPIVLEKVGEELMDIILQTKILALNAAPK